MSATESECGGGRESALGARVFAAYGALLLVATTACSRPDRAPPPPSSATISSTPAPPATSTPTATPAPTASVARASFTVTAVGTPFGLRIEAGTLSFCDPRGGRKVDAATSTDGPFQRACPKDGEANGACSGLPLDVEVSTPNLGPNDVVDVGGNRFHLDGRVHDCAADASTKTAALAFTRVGDRFIPVAPATAAPLNCSAFSW